MHRRSGGFTVIELVVVIVILGVLAITALPRFFDRQMFEARGFHDGTLGLLRYAQKAAIAQRRTVCVSFGASSASLGIASAAGSATCDLNLAGPDGTAPYSLHAPGGIAYSSTPSDFSFDSWGRASSGQTIQVHGVNEPIVVEAATGLVHR
ncbi:prepilin-type N-terminal cleavage/methylation domain-containing protein [Methyloterricola oryzae]|uniref:prepilin-type N-terminal cleavage/methylation domain-containing protein n=1 Tax=Methyloterricola oryzae TaxID=1495050 RepID=UPI0005EB5708